MQARIQLSKFLVAKIGNVAPVIIAALVGEKTPNNGKIDGRLRLAKGAEQRVFAEVPHVADVSVLHIRLRSKVFSIELAV